MEKWKAIPLIGVYEIKFGMSRNDVRKVMNRQFKEFKKSKYSKNTTDDFGVCHVFYNKEDRCQAVEVFQNVEIQIDGSVIFPQSTDKLLKISDDFTDDEGCYISKALSIGIYAPEGKMESILLAEKGYY